MDQNSKSLSESIRTLVPLLPKAIQDFFAARAIEPIDRRLVEKYHLRVDQGTVLEREILLMLLGINRPAASAEALRTDGALDDALTTQIFSDINDQVFKPLQQKMHEAGEAQPAPITPPAPPMAKPSPPPRPMQPPPAPVQAPQPMPPPMPTSPPAPIQKPMPPTPPAPPHIPSAPKSLQPSPFDQPRESTPPSTPPPPVKSAPPPANLPGVVTAKEPPAPDHLLADHEEQHIEVSGLPGAPQSKPPAEVPPVTSYSKDPYREPFDEHANDE